MRKAVRLVFYLAFVVGAVVFWAFFFAYALTMNAREGSVRTLEGYILQGVFWLALPATALAFVLYRRLIRWAIGVAPDFRNSK